jgi:hypothetical protein
MDKDIHCNICGYPHVKIRDGIKSITIATVSRDPNILCERTPVSYDTSLYKDESICHMCWYEQHHSASVNTKRIKREQKGR